MLFITKLCVVVLAKRNVSYLPKKLNYYEILGVKPNASLEEIKAAFVKKSTELHPDRKSKPKDARLGWSRKSDTELFMEMKEAYDCLRNPNKRATYDEEVVSSAGYLREATHLKFKKDTTVDFNRTRESAYMGPRSKNSTISCHFRDPEKEYYQEKHMNRMLVVLAIVFGGAVLTNIGYVCCFMITRSNLDGIKVYRSLCSIQRMRHFSSKSSIRDYYQILGLQRDATQRQIKSAYYELSKKYHPDVAGRSVDAEAKFLEITEAYECLKDPEKRKIYDVEDGGRMQNGDFFKSKDFAEYSTRRPGNSFQSRRFTWREYEKIWEEFNRMKNERESYDGQMRRESEKLWEEFINERASRRREFRTMYPNEETNSFRYTWKWTTRNPKGYRATVLLSRIFMAYMICFVVLTFFRIVLTPLSHAFLPKSNKKHDVHIEQPEETRNAIQFHYMNYPPPDYDGIEWSDVTNSPYPSSNMVGSSTAHNNLSSTPTHHSV